MSSDRFTLSLLTGGKVGRPAGAHDNVAKLLLQIGNSVRRSDGRQRGSLAEAGQILIVERPFLLPAPTGAAAASQRRGNAHTPTQTRSLHRQYIMQRCFVTKFWQKLKGMANVLHHNWNAIAVQDLTATITSILSRLLRTTTNPVRWDRRPEKTILDFSLFFYKVDFSQLKVNFVHEIQKFFTQYNKNWQRKQRGYYCILTSLCGFIGVINYHIMCFIWSLWFLPHLCISVNL